MAPELQAIIDQLATGHQAEVDAVIAAYNAGLNAPSGNAVVLGEHWAVKASGKLLDQMHATHRPEMFTNDLKKNVLDSIAEGARLYRNLPDAEVVRVRVTQI